LGFAQKKFSREGTTVKYESALFKNCVYNAINEFDLLESHEDIYSIKHHANKSSLVQLYFVPIPQNLC